MRCIKRLVPEDSIDGEIFGRLKVFRSVSGQRPSHARESSAIGGREGGNVREPTMKMRKRLRGGGEVGMSAK